MGDALYIGGGSELPRTWASAFSNDRWIVNTPVCKYLSTFVTTQLPQLSFHDFDVLYHGMIHRIY